MDQFTIWAPPPEIAEQLIFSLLQCWTERPLSTCFALLIPRVLQKHRHRVSRHVLNMGAFDHDVIPAHWTNQLLKIPACLLYVPSHMRSLTASTMDMTPLSSEQRSHQQQATLMRGVPTAPAEGFVPTPV